MRANIFDGVSAKLVDIDSIKVYTDVQPRTQLIKSYVAELVEALQRREKLPPLCVLKDPVTKELVLASGFHRIEARRRLGDTRVHCKIAPGTRVDARDYATETNLIHGLKRSNADKRRVVDRALELHPRRSNKKHARRLHVSDVFVGQRRQLMLEAKGANVCPQDVEPVRRAFDVVFESEKIRGKVRKLAERCHYNELSTLGAVLTEISDEITKQRNRMTAGGRWPVEEVNEDQ